MYIFEVSFIVVIVVLFVLFWLSVRDIKYNCQNRIGLQALIDWFKRKVTEMTGEEMRNQNRIIMAAADMVQGNINRMCVTDEMKELVERKEYAKQEIDGLYKLCMQRLQDRKNGGKEL